MKFDRKKMAIAAGIVLLILAGYGLVTLLKQPSTADFDNLDAERQVVDTSMSLYVPLFSDYSSSYANVYAEQRSDDEKTELKKQYVDMLEQERRINEARLNDMGSSIALKQPDVKKAFDTFDDKYSAVVNYYEQHVKNIAAVTESVGGPCAELTKLNVSVQSYASDYTKTADACLKALATAKETTDGTTKKLLEDVEELIKERRDKFKAVEGKEGFDQTVSKLQALVSIIDINTDVKAAQDDYEAKTKEQYTKLVDEANDANDALRRALESHLSGAAKKEEA